MRWLNCEFRLFKYASLYGYLKRYGAVTAAAESGIEIRKETERLPEIGFESSEETACLAFHSLKNVRDKSVLMNSLNDQDELTKILGKYVQMDVIESGTFSRVLMEELTSNVFDHAKASVSWICTRLIDGPNKSIFSSADPLVKLLLNNTDYLEINVYNNGLQESSTRL